VTTATGSVKPPAIISEVSTMGIDASVLAGLPLEDLKALLAQAAAQNPEAFGAVIKENDDAKRAAKSAIGGTRGRTRAPSFLSGVMEAALVAMAGGLEVDAVEGDDSATVTNVLKAMVERIREKKDGAGTQEAYTLSYDESGVTHKVRVTFLSETAAADSVLAKALGAINVAGEENFGGLVDKWRKSIKRQRVDSAVRDEHLEDFEDAVLARKTELMGDNGAASTAPPAPPV